ncbi:ParB-like protein [Paraburkholderia sp. BL25I1N1]|uniref:ParB-like protein n=1 Tax=Paraburkholderia sp. BL25I1N1 TaxID=1938804 RepID=UPI0021595660|nr:ParB-like protein [Paraburkholderia sp. BL25I1N1]
MPEHAWEMADDECRSLAASVCDAVGYEQTTAPVEEFRWADLFRSNRRSTCNSDRYRVADHRAHTSRASVGVCRRIRATGPSPWRCTEPQRRPARR